MTAAAITSWTRADYTDWCAAVTRRHFASPKHLAAATGGSPATAKNWIEGRTGIDGLALLKLLVADKGLRAELDHLLAASADRDPAWQRDMAEMLRVGELLLQHRRSQDGES